MIFLEMYNSAFPASSLNFKSSRVKNEDKTIRFMILKLIINDHNIVMIEEFSRQYLSRTPHVVLGYRSLIPSSPRLRWRSSTFEWHQRYGFHTLPLDESYQLTRERLETLPKRYGTLFSVAQEAKTTG